MTPEEALHVLEGPDGSHNPVDDARIRNRRRFAADLLGDLARQMGRTTQPLVGWFDWDRLKVNVAHLVSPKIVRWSDD